MISSAEIQDLFNTGGGTVVGQDGDKIGKVGQVYLDDQSGEPEWVTVSTGLFGGKESFVPLAQSTLSGDEIRVPYDKSKVKDAPQIDSDSDGHISKDQEAELYSYYSLADPDPDRGAAETETVYNQDARTVSRGRDDADAADAVGQDEGRDTSGVTTDEAMTRSEEQLKVGTAKVATGKARLRKFVVTEQQTVTVPVRREEVTLEREPITDANRGDAMDGPELSEEEHEMTLHEEQVVVDKNVVPVERVTMAKNIVSEDQQVTEDVRKEQIEHVVDDHEEHTGAPVERADEVTHEHHADGGDVSPR